MKRLLLLSLVLGTLSVNPAFAAPILTECHTEGIETVCNVYPSIDDAGTPVASDISDPFTLPDLVTAGYVVLKEDPGTDDTNPANWSDVLVFFDTDGGESDLIRLFSAGCNVAPGDRSCFPSFATVDAAPHIFINKFQGGIGDDFVDFTTYQADVVHQYNIFSASDVDVEAVPEPATLSLLGAGLLGLVRSARKRAARRG